MKGIVLALAACLFLFLTTAVGCGSIGVRRSTEFWNVLLILAMVFHGFWVFAYVACVGPSARIVLALSKQHARQPPLDRPGPEAESGNTRRLISSSESRKWWESSVTACSATMWRRDRQTGLLAEF